MELTMDFTVTKLHLYRHLGRPGQPSQPGRFTRRDRNDGPDAAGGWEVAAVFAFGGSLVPAVPEAADADGVTEVPAASAPETTPVVSV